LRRRLLVGVAAFAVAPLTTVVPPLVLAALVTAAFLEKGRQLVRRGIRTLRELTREWE
jgi:hypothetical protein